MKEKIAQLARELGVSQIHFVRVDDMPNTPYAISIVVALSEQIISEIDQAPTHSYFHHYRTVNAYIDQCLLRLGLFLQSQGYSYIPIPASQSVNTKDNYFEGRYSHKKVACLAGAGYIGKSNLFLSHEYGPAVRLGTLFTDCELLNTPPVEQTTDCGNCNLCQKACPAGAILGVNATQAKSRLEMFDPQACSDYMKSAFKMIGRGAVCGICISHCKKFKNR